MMRGYQKPGGIQGDAGKIFPWVHTKNDIEDSH